MNKNISDIIEQYLKHIMENNQTPIVELQRNELAEQFQCVPSQINYVISTRFTMEQGYIVESKRGGGGYIRIRQIQLDSHQLLLEALHAIGESLAQREAEGLIERLLREGLITQREAMILRAAASRDVLRIALPDRDELRARLMTQMLAALFLAESDT